MGSKHLGAHQTNVNVLRSKSTMSNHF
jgi:hypothetical protein